MADARVTQPRRIVSLIPSATEIVAALGYADWLVGRSHECDQPTSIRGLPACTGPLIDTSGDSGEIHRQIGEEMARAGDAQQAISVYEIDTSLLEALAPDVVITQSQCSVCAVSEWDVHRAIEGMVDTQPTVVACEPSRLRDVWRDIERIAEAIGDPEAGRSLVRELHGRMRRIADRAGDGTEPPRVGCLEWLDPLMGCGNWIPELVELAGGVSVFGEAGAHADWLDWSRLSDASLDRLVAIPCGFDLERTVAELETRLYDEAWQALPMVRAGQLYAGDGHAYFNRPGPRLVESLAILAEILHPELFSPEHKGSGWRRQPTSAAAEASS